jgi:hypothetical protein
VILAPFKRSVRCPPSAPRFSRSFWQHKIVAVHTNHALTSVAFSLSSSLSLSSTPLSPNLAQLSGTLLLLSAGTASPPSYGRGSLESLYLLFLHRVSALSGQNTSLAATFSASPLHCTSSLPFVPHATFPLSILQLLALVNGAMVRCSDHRIWFRGPLCARAYILLC